VIENLWPRRPNKFATWSSQEKKKNANPFPIAWRKQVLLEKEPRKREKKKFP
jgi:hypothetical protein